jgi:manganese/zinc/iron transport system substrate-binding protein
MKTVTGIRFFLLSALLVLCAACAESSGSVKREGKIKVVTTTAMVGDLARNIAGEKAEVISLMGTGIDPHLYKASAGDVERLAGADMIFYNGLHLEGKLTDVLAQMRKGGIFTVGVAEGIDKSLLFSPEEYEGYYDPHIWFDVVLWKKAAKVVMEAFSHYDPQNAPIYKSNTESYIKELDLLQAYIHKKIALLRHERKVLITAHDAFNYFGRGYGFEVIGLQGISTDSEASVADIQNLSRVIAERRIPAVFVETSISPRYMRALQASVKARGFDVRIGGSLYSDSMGGPGTEEGSYIGMFRSNVDTIVESLSRSIEVADSEAEAAGDG